MQQQRLPGFAAPLAGQKRPHDEGSPGPVHGRGTAGGGVLGPRPPEAFHGPSGPHARAPYDSLQAPPGPQMRTPAAPYYMPATPLSMTAADHAPPALQQQRQAAAMQQHTGAPRAPPDEQLYRIVMLDLPARSYAEFIRSKLAGLGLAADLAFVPSQRAGGGLAMTRMDAQQAGLRCVIGVAAANEADMEAYLTVAADLLTAGLCIENHRLPAAEAVAFVVTLHRLGPEEAVALLDPSSLLLAGEGAVSAESVGAPTQEVSVPSLVEGIEVSAAPPAFSASAVAGNSAPAVGAQQSDGVAAGSSSAAVATGPQHYSDANQAFRQDASGRSLERATFEGIPSEAKVEEYPGDDDSDAAADSAEAEALAIADIFGDDAADAEEDTS